MILCKFTKIYVLYINKSIYRKKKKLEFIGKYNLKCASDSTQDCSTSSSTKLRYISNKNYILKCITIWENNCKFQRSRQKVIISRKCLLKIFHHSICERAHIEKLKNTIKISTKALFSNCQKLQNYRRVIEWKFPNGNSFRKSGVEHFKLDVSRGERTIEERQSSLFRIAFPSFPRDIQQYSRKSISRARR